MKSIWKAAAGLALALGMTVQCTPYDDAWIKDEIKDLKEQISNLQKSINALDAYKTLLDKGRLISEVVDHGDGTFTVHFADGTPSVTLDAGRGEPGESGVTPAFKIEDGNWLVSYDEGATWTVLGSASSGDSFFKNVSVQGDYLVLVLIDNTEVRINLKGGSGEGGGEQGGGGEGDEQSLSWWLGEWTHGYGDYQFDVTLTEGEGGIVYLCWGDIVKIPFEYEEATGNLLLKMPENRWIGASEDNDINYYLNLYNTSNKRINPDAGTLLVTLSKQDDNTAVCTRADESYFGFYARPYTTSTSSWGDSIFWFDLEDGLARKTGGGGGSGESTLADWEGNWSKSGSVLTFARSGEDLTVSFSGLSFPLTPKGDGTMSFAQPQYGWVGTDSESNDYYLYTYSGSSTYVEMSDGSEIMVASLAEDKQSITLAAPSGAAFDRIYIGIYSAAQSWVGWFSNPTNLLGTYTKE